MNKGMSLIEVLVIMTMILILTSLIFINPRPSTDLDRAGRQLVADLRHAQSMAMAAQVDSVDGSVPDFYCIRYNNSSQYTLSKADEDLTNPGNPDADSFVVIGDPIAFHSSSVIINDTSEVCFKTPNGYVSQPKTIQIQHSNGSTRTININSGGAIELQ